MTRTPLDLPVVESAADERTTLEQFLDFQRAVFARKMAGLDLGQLGRRIDPSPLTLGGLWFHMTLVEGFWFEEGLHGLPGRPPFDTAPWDDEPDWEFDHWRERTPDELDHLHRTAVERARAAAAEVASLDEHLARPGHHGEAVSLRWTYVHMIEEYARHCGHADLLRERIDGATGD